MIWELNRRAEKAESLISSLCMKANVYLCDWKWIVTLNQVAGFPGERVVDTMRMMGKNRWYHDPSQRPIFELMRGTEGGLRWDCREVQFAKSANFVDDGAS
jgi:hypothetical protein